MKNKTNRTEKFGTIYFILSIVLFWVLIVCSICNTIKLGIIALIIYTIMCLLLFIYAFGDRPKSKVRIAKIIIGSLVLVIITLVPCAIIYLVRWLLT